MLDDYDIIEGVLNGLYPGKDVDAIVGATMQAIARVGVTSGYYERDDFLGLCSMLLDKCYDQWMEEYHG